MEVTGGSEAPRPYHHGNLRAALLQAAVRLVREGGLPALTLRVASRVVGVSANAVYHHFADLDELRRAVGQVARREMADRMLTELAGAPRPVDAVARYKAVGRGYVQFAVAEPGLFSAAFFAGNRVGHDPGQLLHSVATAPDTAAGLLVHALEDMAHAGTLTPDEVPAAATTSWAGVHGLATLLLGPLQGLDAEQREHTIEATLSHLVHAVGSPPHREPDTNQ